MATKKRTVPAPKPFIPKGGTKFNPKSKYGCGGKVKKSK